MNETDNLLLCLIFLVSLTPFSSFFMFFSYLQKMSLNNYIKESWISVRISLV